MVSLNNLQTKEVGKVNQTIIGSRKRIENLWLLVDDQQKRLSLMKTKTESTVFVVELQRALKNLETVLSQEHQRCTGLEKAAARA
jgi:hypothetical protein